MVSCSSWLFAFYGSICLLVVPGSANPCYLCGNPDCTLDNPDAVISLPSPSPISEATCGQIMMYGIDGIIPSDMCGMTEQIRGMCGCNCPSPSDNKPPTTTPASPPVSAPQPTVPVVPIKTDPPVGDSVMVTFAPTTMTDDDNTSPGQAVLATETNNPTIESSFTTNTLNGTMNPSMIDNALNSTNDIPGILFPTITPSFRSNTQAPSFNSASTTQSPTNTPTIFNGTLAPATSFPYNTFFPTASSNAHDSRHLRIAYSWSQQGLVVFGTAIICTISWIP